MKKYEIALLYGSKNYDDVETFEYKTKEEMYEWLIYFFNNHRNNLVKIEVSLLQQDENEETENAYTFMEIYVDLFETMDKMIRG